MLLDDVAVIVWLFGAKRATNVVSCVTIMLRGLVVSPSFQLRKRYPELGCASIVAVGLSQRGCVDKVYPLVLSDVVTTSVWGLGSTKIPPPVQLV